MVYHSITVFPCFKRHSFIFYSMCERFASCSSKSEMRLYMIQACRRDVSKQ